MIYDVIKLTHWIFAWRQFIYLGGHNYRRYAYLNYVTYRPFAYLAGLTYKLFAYFHLLGLEMVQ